MHIENNNNVSFGAYFKNNQLLRDTYLAGFRKVDKKILDKFVKECPNHEIEIRAIQERTYGQTYIVFNNMTGGYFKVSTKHSDRPLDTIMKRLTGLHASEDAGTKEDSFWKNSPMIDNFRALTGMK